jgi:hypothetical protein
MRIYEDINKRDDLNSHHIFCRMNRRRKMLKSAVVICILVSSTLGGKIGEDEAQVSQCFSTIFNFQKYNYHYVFQTNAK